MCYWITRNLDIIDHLYRFYCNIIQFDLQDYSQLGSLNHHPHHPDKDSFVPPHQEELHGSLEDAGATAKDAGAAGKIP